MYPGLRAKGNEVAGSEKAPPFFSLRRIGEIWGQNKRTPSPTEQSPETRFELDQSMIRIVDSVNSIPTVPRALEALRSVAFLADDEEMLRVAKQDAIHYSSYRGRSNQLNRQSVEVGIKIHILKGNNEQFAASSEYVEELKKELADNHENLHQLEVLYDEIQSQRKRLALEFEQSDEYDQAVQRSFEWRKTRQEEEMKRLFQIQNGTDPYTSAEFVEQKDRACLAIITETLKILGVPDSEIDRLSQKYLYNISFSMSFSSVGRNTLNSGQGRVREEYKSAPFVGSSSSIINLGCDFMLNPDYKYNDAIDLIHETVHAYWSERGGDRNKGADLILSKLVDLVFAQKMFERGLIKEDVFLDEHDKHLIHDYMLIHPTHRNKIAEFSDERDLFKLIKEFDKSGNDGKSVLEFYRVGRAIFKLIRPLPDKQKVLIIREILNMNDDIRGREFWKATGMKLSALKEICFG